MPRYDNEPRTASYQEISVNAGSLANRLERVMKELPTGNNEWKQLFRLVYNLRAVADELAAMEKQA